MRGMRGEEPLKIELGATELSLHRPTGVESLAWFDHAALTRRLLASIPKTEGGLSAVAKAQRLERLRADLLAAERVEKSLIESAEASGVSVKRRVNASPLALLGVAIVHATAESAAA